MVGAGAAAAAAIFCLFAVMSVLLVPPPPALAATPSSPISDGVFDSHPSAAARSLLQAKKACPINFEFMNYTVITSQCKGPKYPPDACCKAFKEFACPYVDQVNDLSNDCASTMFSYINLNGKYPPGLFAAECREGKLGLACPAPSPAQSLQRNANANASAAPPPPPSFLLLLLFPSIFLPLFHCFRI